MKDNEVSVSAEVYVQELFPLMPKKDKVRVIKLIVKQVEKNPKALNFEALKNIVYAHIRHSKTKYDHSIDNGMRKKNARTIFSTEMHEIFKKWRGNEK